MAKVSGGLSGGATIRTPQSSSGWGNQVLNILFTIFILGIVFGALLIAVATTNTTISNLQGQFANQSMTYSGSTTPSIAATDISGANALTFSVAGSSYWISASNPLTITVTGNYISSYATNTAYAASSASKTEIFTVTSNSPHTLNALDNFYSISSVVLTHVYQEQPSITVTLDEFYAGAVRGSAPASYIGNSVEAVTVLTATPSSMNIGTSSSTPVSVFGALAAYMVTLSNFVGIIILLAIIVVIIGVLYYFFGNKSSSAFSGV